MEALIDSLKDSMLFSALPDAALQQFSRAMERRTIKAGNVIVREGDPCDSLYIVEHGELLEYVHNSELNLEFELSRPGPGDHFGETAMLSGDPYRSSLRTEKKSELLVLPRSAFLHILLATPQAALVLTQEMARRLAVLNDERQLQFERLSSLPFNPKLYGSFPRHILESNRVIPLSLSGHILKVAMVDPTNGVALDDIRRSMFGVQVEPVAISAADYARFVGKKIKPAIRAGLTDPDKLPVLDASATDPNEIEYFTPYDPARKDNQQMGTKAVEIIDQILAKAIDLNASDIHLVPEGPSLAVRFRVDGRLRDWDVTLPVHFQPTVTSRIKILTGLDIAERRIPQDGRFALRVGQTNMDIRVATMPSKDGERVTMRLLNPEQNLMPLDQIFLSDKISNLMRQMIFRPNGMVLITGPTGSGKTTTMYSALSERIRHSRDFNIMSVEDPIEYSLPGITQVQINEAAGLDFPKVLRSFLRHDPDVLMVGEMRDQITARIAAQAALTGHLVLSSMHTIDSIGTVDRLADMGLEPYLVANSLIGVVSQRLLRRVCPHCARTEALPENLMAKLRLAGVLAEGEQLREVYSGSGCVRCNMTGFSGRVGAYEIMPMNPTMQTVITQEASRSKRRQLAIGAGLVPLERYCRFLLLNHLTTPAEVLRILSR